MAVEKSVFAYQLEVGMWIFINNCWRKIKSLKGSFVSGRGLVVTIELSVGSVQVASTYALSVRYAK